MHTSGTRRNDKLGEAVKLRAPNLCKDLPSDPFLVAQAVLLVYDVTNRKSFADLSLWLEDLAACGAFIRTTWSQGQESQGDSNVESFESEFTS